MKIVVTGASGFVGREIVLILQSMGANMLLVGRDTNKLQKIFPESRVTNYENLLRDARGYDTLLHLAVMNNDQLGNLKEFRVANVEFLKSTLETMISAGMKTLIYPTSLRVANLKNVSPYEQSKREAEDFLSNAKEFKLVVLRLPAVYGTTFAGKLAFLSKVPKLLRGLIFTFLSSFKPTVHVRRVSTIIFDSAEKGEAADLVLSEHQKGNWFYAMTKRVVDLCFVFFVILFLWWVLAIAWLAVKFSSPGPGFFAQTRVGKNGSHFTCYKFRTMKVGTKQVGTHEVEVSSITKVGHFLRKTKVDELPQAWNIFKNELSLIGPRPCLPVQELLIAERNRLGVLDVKAGITGWAQVHGVDMSNPQELAEMDSYYITMRTILLDLRILVATAVGKGRGDRIIV